MSDLVSKIGVAVDFIRSRSSVEPSIGLILGSGLGSLAEKIEDSNKMATSDLPYYAPSTVPGHSGELVLGSLGKKSVMAFKGRVHFYEGYTMEQVTFSVRLMAALGVRTLIVTNAAGGLNPQFTPGDLMLITSHINLFFQNPLQGINDAALGPRFPDMESDYDREWVNLAEATAVRSGIRTQRGVYAAHSGPTYETRSEVRMLQKMGADAVGMSTIPEVIVAKHHGMRVLGISCITNMGTGISREKLTHEEVTTTADRVRSDFQRLLTETIRLMD